MPMETVHPFEVEFWRKPPWEEALLVVPTRDDASIMSNREDAPSALPTLSSMLNLSL